MLKPTKSKPIDASLDNLKTSIYYNQTLAPTIVVNKNWGVGSFVSCWIGMNICIPAYQMTSAAISMGLSWWLALILVLTGNIIILFPIILNSQLGIKYGIPFPIQARMAFGFKGAKFPILLRSIIGAAWTGILIWSGAESIHNAMLIIFESWEDFKYGQIVCFVLFWTLNIGISLGGSNIYKKFENISAPILGCFCLALFVWGTINLSEKGYNWYDAVTCLQNSQDVNISKTILAILVANISYYSTWAVNISDLSRYAKNSKTHMIGTSLGLPFSMFLISFIGIYITGTTKILFGTPLWNPNEVINAIGNKSGALFAALAISLATLTTNVTTNILPPANGISSFFPKKLDYKKSVLVTGIIAIAIQPWKLASDPSGYIYDWLNIYGMLTGPIASILICDYYIINRKKISIEQLYINCNSKFWYKNGYNIRAFLTWILSVTPSFIGIANNKFAIFKEYGWILSFMLGFIVYYIFMIKGDKHNDKV